MKSDRHVLILLELGSLCETKLVFVLARVNTRTPSDMDKGAVMP